MLPPGIILAFQDWYISRRYQANADNTRNNLLDRANEQLFDGRPYQEHRSYLFITRKPAQRKPGQPVSSLLQPTLFPEEILDERIVQEFLGCVGPFERILADSGLVQLRRIPTPELAGDGQHIGIIEQYCQLNPVNLPPQLRDVDLADGRLRIGEYETLLFSLTDDENLPSHCNSWVDYLPYSTERTSVPVGFSTALGPLLGCNHIHTQYIILEDTQPLLKKLELKRRRLQSLSAHSRENVATREAVEEFLNEAATGQKRLVKFHSNVLAWTDDSGKVPALRNTLSSAISRTGALPHIATVGAAQIWWAGIPGNAADLPYYETWDCFAEQAACFLVPESHYRSSGGTFGVRLGDRISGRPVLVDLSDEPMANGTITNRNKIVLGGSGSGKSFFMNHLMHSYYEQGAHSVIVDIGNSYKGLCELVGGYYFTYTESDPIRFNPFWLPKGEVLDIEKKESIKTLLVALWKSGDETVLRSEYVALSNALQGYYEKLKKGDSLFPCFNSFYDYLRDDFARVLATDRVKDKEFDLENFLYVLGPYYKNGEYDFLLNATEHMDLLQQRFIVFELDNLKSHPILFSVVTIIIMETFISKMRKLPGIRKVILVEEAWRAIIRQGTGEFLQFLYKTIRKHFGVAIVVTQEVEDIISSPIVKQAIINNADCKILLDQSKFQNRFDEIQNVLGLTDTDKALVLSVNKANEPGRKYKEVFIALGNAPAKVYRTELSLEAYYTFTTEESEKVLVQRYAAREGSFRAGVEALAAEVRSAWKNINQ